MKILILMPLDEKWVYMANGIYSALPAKAKDVTFGMPIFMQYCMTTKATPNWIYAVYDALVAVRSVYEAAKDEDLIIIGNCSKDLEFDEIFNFQDIEEDMPFEDKFMEKIQELVKEDESLTKYVNNLYTNDDSKMALHNITATADFIAAYLETDPKIEQIKNEYKDKIKLKKYGRFDKNTQA